MEKETSMAADEVKEVVSENELETELQLLDGVRKKHNWFNGLKKINWRQFIATLMLNALITVICVVWIIPVVKMQNDKIRELDSKLSHEAQVSDVNIHDTLMKIIQQLERNMTHKIEQLETNYTTELQALREKLDETETNYTTELQALREKLDETESDLHSATARISELEQSHSVTVRAMQDRLDSMEGRLDDVTQRLSGMESEVSSARAAIAELNSTKASKVDVEHVTSEIDTRKVDKTEFGVLSRNLTSLRESTSREDEEIRDNLTELASTVSELATSTVGTSDFLETIVGIENATLILQGLVLELETAASSARAEIAELNTTKASKGELDDLTAEVMLLDARKVDKTEFETLSRNLTSLRELTAREVEALREEISELDNSTLNQTHHDQLLDKIYRLEASKANQTALVELASTVSELNSTVSEFASTVSELNSTDSEFASTVSELNSTVSEFASTVSELNSTVSEFASTVSELNSTVSEFASTVSELSSTVSELNSTVSELNSTVSELANSTVRAGEFVQLSQTVEGIENKTVVLQQVVLQLALNVTTLENHTSEGLTTKADQHDLDSLLAEVTVLSETKVNTTTFQELEHTVETLSTSKAEKADLNELKGTVNHLKETTARESEVGQLDSKVTSHITSSDLKHDDLSTDIGLNNARIQNNSIRIGDVENASSCGLMSTWMITAVTMFTIIIKT